MLVEAGLTPLQAITIATSNTAGLLKLDDRDSVAAGKLADLVVLDADPSGDIVTEKLYDAAFVGSHTTGFEEGSRHVLPFTPTWAAEETGLEASQIVSFARAYASTRPAMVLLGGSSMHKGANGWHAARAISCLPGLIGNFGLPGRTWPTSWRTERRFPELERA